MKCLLRYLSLMFLLEGTLSASAPQFYSQCGQDAYLYEHFFSNKKGGVFVDIGAHDGVSLSNTYFFEKNLGWTGICIEPIPAVFDLLKSCRISLCVHGCICSKYDVVNFLTVNGPHAMLSGIYEYYDPKHLERIYRSIQLDGGSVEICSVKCYDFNKLLKEHGIYHVDYLSIDTEGGELEILKSIDFDTIDIQIIDVENNFSTPDFKEFLEGKGYLLIQRLAQDEIYLKAY